MLLPSRARKAVLAWPLRAFFFYFDLLKDFEMGPPPSVVVLSAPAARLCPFYNVGSPGISVLQPPQKVSSMVCFLLLTFALSFPKEDCAKIKV